MITLNIGAESIDFLKLKYTKKNYIVDVYTRAALPKNIISQQRITDPEALENLLEQTIKRLNLSVWNKPKAIMALSLHQVISKNVPIIPGLNTRELEQHLQHIVNAQAATASTEIVWDYKLLPQDPQSIHAEALLVMAQQTIIFDYWKALTKLGIYLQVMDVENFALARAWKACYHNADKNKFHGIVLLRQELISLTIVNDPICYAKALPVDIQLNYQEAAINAIMQLIKNMQIDSNQLILWIAGDCAKIIDPVSIEQQLEIKTYVVECPKHIQIKKTSEEFYFPAYFLNLGLSYWSFEHER